MTFIERAEKQISVLLEAGMQLSLEEIREIRSRAYVADEKEYAASAERQKVFIEANLVAYSLDNPKHVLTVECRTCKEKFQTNYRFQKYCSQECLKTGVLQRGLKWDPEKSELERWSGLPPTTIQPETLKQLLVWAQEIVQQFENPDSYRGREKPALVPYEYSAALPGEPPGPPPPDVLEDES